MIEKILSFLFPKLCYGCFTNLNSYEKYLCINCIHNAPLTGFHLNENNLLKSNFKGLVPLEFAYALFYYKKETGVQECIHQLKYKKQEKIGLFFGKWFSEVLKNNENLKSVDIILPVPIHTKRKIERSYNQVHLFVETISTELNIVYDFKALKRIKHTNTQTKKNKKNRFNLLEHAFDLNTGHNLENKHILLVDDVVTTGATIEACWLTLKKVPNIKISLLSIAYAES